MVLFVTDDGSHSVYSEQYNVSYHSKHGAIQETQHVFIDAGLKPLLEKKPYDITILEIGFGTGLNALMTYNETLQSDVKIHYLTLEAYPLSTQAVKQLNYIERLNVSSLKPIFDRMHESEWNTYCGGKPNISHSIQLNTHFIFQKIKTDFKQIDFDGVADVIYFDAFAPNAQPELWEVEMLQKMYEALRIGGVLTTYCAKGVVKRTLKSVGFFVEELPGPPGKREMTRAWKK